MKEDRNFLSIALVICLTLFLGGCAGNNVETSNTGNTETEATVTAATETEDNNPEGRSADQRRLSAFNREGDQSDCVMGRGQQRDFGENYLCVRLCGFAARIYKAGNGTVRVAARC